jgi:hypothetical protein
MIYSGQITHSWAGIKQPRPEYPKPGRNNALTRLGRDSLTLVGPAPFPPAGLAFLSPARPVIARPGWAFRPTPRSGLKPALRLGLLAARALAGRLLCSARLGRIRRIRPSRDYFSRPPSASPGWAGFVYSGQAWPGFPWSRPDYLSPGRISPLWAGIYSLRGISFIWHQFHRHVPVLGCPLAQTGTSSIVICWSWDAPWPRPAYSTSPSQPYPQEEDKTDDMEIQKTHARRRRPRTPRTDSNGTSP